MGASAAVSCRKVAMRWLLAVAVVSPFASFGRNRVMRKEKHLGQIYTPAYLVEDILDCVGYTAGGDILERHVIDNSCGDGAFLEEIVRRYAAAYSARRGKRRSLASHLSEYVHGVEIDAQAHAACLERLNAVALELGLGEVAWDVRKADTLKTRDYDGHMDFVVGNPPYVRVHNLAENFDEVKSFGFSDGGMTDLYLVFYEVGLKMLNGTGRLCYIAPSSWINSLAGRRMRAHVRDNHCLLGIVDLEHFQPFKATAYTAIVSLCRHGGGAAFDYGVYEGPHRIRPVDRLGYDEAFFAGALYLGSRKTLAVHRAILEADVPKHVCVKNGFATLADDVFIADDFPFNECVIPVLKASTGKWRKAFFPYDKDGRPMARKKVFENKAISQYLRCNKRQLLKGRREADAQGWYLYGRTQALKDVAVEKYAVNTCVRDVKSIKFNRVPAGAGVYSGLYILTAVDESVLREVLLSGAFVDFVRALKKYKSGGYYTFSSRDLERYLNFMIHRRLVPGAKMRQGELGL